MRHLKVQLMLGDYQVDHQPFWDSTYSTLDSAVVAADRTWDWFWKEWYPAHRSATGQIDLSVVCVFVYDDDTDELCEHALYVRGNPACDE